MQLSALRPLGDTAITSPMNKCKQISVRVEPDVFDALARTAEAERRPLGSLIRIVLDDWRNGQMVRADRPQHEAST
jgi:hypothetical protein